MLESSPSKWSDVGIREWLSFCFPRRYLYWGKEKNSTRDTDRNYASRWCIVKLFKIYWSSTKHYSIIILKCMQKQEFCSHGNQNLNALLFQGKIPLIPALVNRLNMAIWKWVMHPLCFPPSNIFRTGEFYRSVARTKKTDKMREEGDKIWKISLMVGLEK